MPAVSGRQRRFMGAELGRLRGGKKTKTGMSESQLSEYASVVETAGRRKKARKAVAR